MRWILPWLIVLMLVFAGCGSGGVQLGQVRGRVTMDGQPLPNVIVTFTPVGGGMASTGTTNAEGYYELVCPQGKGAVVGQHKVSVRSQQGAGGQAPEVRSDDPAYQYGGEASQAAAPPPEKIPARYNVNSQLVFEVKPGLNEINLELTSQP
ncbi:MAG: carboxypeptidase-like regulatory domain-containing protein [Thermoguttaceae bacterium]|nr:carboxypeptidase-like regulatory domain-containing protein [Thermoguttaceae bacterium]MDW8077560.1 carboxypeptidase-like regulatory domain-containing protein [Thermoguttaceae bacterium]